ncbi:MAG TPA: hypothetical protein PKC28_14240, partial [Bdellovibrionales bacterium]|nr:hypothetical protein [Bdellovibrionales bacterium]
KTLTVKNITANEVTLSIETAVTPGLAIAVQSQVTVPAGGSAQVPVEVTLSMVAPDKLLLEMEGRVIFRQGARIAAQVPALAMRTQASQILSPQTSVGGGVAFTNTSPNDGLALAFNLLGEDGRKSAASSVDAWKSTACDLQSAGYRVIQRATPQGVIDYIQFAVKVYAANTSWLGCEVSVLIDGDEDGIADQELAGAAGGALEGVGPAQFASLLLDAHKARQIRLSYEIGLAAGIEGKLNYAPALIDASGMAPFPNSSIALIEGRLDKLMRSADGKLNIKIAALNVLGDAVEADDYLGSGLVGFGKLSPLPAEHPYYGMSEYSVVSKAAGGAATMSKGSGTGKLILYYPFNPMDAQYQVLD